MGQSAQNRAFVPPIIKPSNLEQTLKDEEYDIISKIMFEQSGVYLDRNKIAMIQARLSKRLSELNLNNFQEYCNYLRKDPLEITEFINSLTTHKTDFFREPEHFEILRTEILPEICARDKTKKLRIWSAASSTGEEAYTLAILISEFLQANPTFSNWDYKILGTDIDTNVVAKASNGIYTSEVAHAIRPDLLQKYFLKGNAANRGFYKIRPEISNMVKFRYHNLLSDLSDLNGLKFQVVFLRNVLIYFQDETREFVINKIYESLVPGGYLFVGHSEPLSMISHRFQTLKSAIYKKV